MLGNYNLENILFLDIETVPAFSTYFEMPEMLQNLWEKKSSQFRSEWQTAAEVYPRAGIYAEFGKVVCISVGIFSNSNSERKFRVKSFFGNDEYQLLMQFVQLLEKSFSSDEYYLCAHNGKEFDFPYLARRILINRIPLPKILDLSGRKPWEIRHLDTLELWKFGDYKHFTSLELLTTIFGIETPKDDITGNDVAKVFWQDNDIQRIVTYCQKDVVSIAQLFLSYRGENCIEKANINIVGN